MTKCIRVSFCNDVKLNRDDIEAAVNHLNNSLRYKYNISASLSEVNVSVKYFVIVIDYDETKIKFNNLYLRSLSQYFTRLDPKKYKPYGNRVLQYCEIG